MQNKKQLELNGFMGELEAGSYVEVEEIEEVEIEELEELV